MMKDPAVSSVISEVLLIALVLILVPIVTISLMNQLPEDRIPTVTILMKISPSQGPPETVILYHKGGDYIKKDDISVIIRIRDPSGSTKESMTYQKKKNNLVFSSNTPIYNLKDSIEISASDFFKDIQSGSDVEVTLIAKNFVVFRGEMQYE